MEQSDQSKPSVLDMLKQAPTANTFQTAEAVDQYLENERDTWEQDQSLKREIELGLNQLHNGQYRTYTSDALPNLS